MKSMKKGFTLVELMVVIVIIGILAALAIPRFLGATNKSKAAEFKPVLKQLYTLQEAYAQENNTYSTSLPDIAFEKPNPNSARFDYVALAPTKGPGVIVGTATYIKDKGINKTDGTQLVGGTDMACIDAEGDQAATADLAAVAGVVSIAAAKAGFPAKCSN